MPAHRSRNLPSPSNKTGTGTLAWLELGLSIQSGWNLGGPDVAPQETAKQLTWSELTHEGPGRIDGPLRKPKSRYDYYRDIAVLAWRIETAGANELGGDGKSGGSIPLGELRLKAMERELGGSAPDCRHLLFDKSEPRDRRDARLSEIVNLTGCLKPDGTLDWSVPEGRWTILRFGYTPTGLHAGTGRVCRFG